MNFIQILTNGYEKVSLPNLHQRYKRDAKDSIDKGYTIESFFNNCFLAIKTVKAEIEKKYISDKSTLEEQISIARSNNDSILEEDCYNRLNVLYLNDTKIDLSTINSTYCKYTIRYEKLNLIKSALETAKKELIDEGVIPEYKNIDDTDYENKLGSGLKTNYEYEELVKIHENLTNGTKSFKTVYLVARIEDFIAICSDKPLPRDFNRVKWVLMSRIKKPCPVLHKDAFREFLAFLYSKVPEDKVIKTLFSDKYNADITKNKPNNTRYSYYYTDFEFIFKKE